MLIPILEQAILILASGWLLTMNVRRGPRSPRLLVLTSGVCFGVISIACMALPFTIAPGVLLDVREAVLFAAGLFGGPLSGGLALLMAAGYRLWLGGAGSLVGLLGMILALAVGLGGRYALQRGWIALNLRFLLPVVVLLHLSTMGLLLLVEPGLRQNILASILPFLLVVVPLTLALVFILEDAGQRRQEQQALRDSEARLRAITRALPDRVTVIDEDGRYLDIMSESAELPYVSGKQVTGKTVREVLPPESADAFTAFIHRTLEQRTVNTLIYELETEQGLRTFESVAQALENRLGDKAAVVILSRDISARIRKETELRIAAVAFDSVQGMLVTDRYHRVLRVNRAFTEVTGYTEEEMQDKTAPMFSDDRLDAGVYRDMWHGIKARGYWQGELCGKRKSGQLYPQWLSVSAVRDRQGQISHYVAVISDISERKKDAEKINHLEFYDTLTGLANRRLLLDGIGEARLHSAESGKQGAVIFIDLDNFKNINDLWGHALGDWLLLQVADRLRHLTGPKDTLARLGRDQFVVLLGARYEDSGKLIDHLEQISHALLERLDKPYVYGDQSLRSSASLGLVVLNAGSPSAEELLRHAELAMYEAKAAGKGERRFFDPEMQKVISRRLLLEEDIVRGLDAHEFCIYFQAQYNDSGEMSGTEALVRWQHPERGLLAPRDFIGVAEAAGLTNRIDHIMLLRACEQMACWARTPAFEQVTVSVNISPAQLYQHGFVDEVLQVLQRTGANPARLKMELTESMLITDMPRAIDRMRALKEVGIRFAIDDFGTGYSSLYYLQQLPLDQLKIDQSFVRRLPEDNNSLAIIRAIIAMARSLGLEVIAEGVETESQRSLLQNNGCRLYQGYLFGRPMPAAEVEARWLTGGRVSN